MQGQNTGWGVGFENGKKWLGNCLGAALGASKICFEPPGSSHERSWTRLGDDLARNLAPGFAQNRPQDASKTALASLRGANKTI